MLKLFYFGFHLQGIPVDRCLWRKNGRIVNLYSEKYDLIGKKAAGDCSVRCGSFDNILIFCKEAWHIEDNLSLVHFRLKHAFRQNAGHYECSADLNNNNDDHRWEEKLLLIFLRYAFRPRRASNSDLSYGIFIDVLCKYFIKYFQKTFSAEIALQKVRDNLSWKLLPQLLTQMY